MAPHLKALSPVKLPPWSCELNGSVPLKEVLICARVNTRNRHCTWCCLSKIDNFFFFFLRQILHCSPGWPGTHYVCRPYWPWTCSCPVSAGISGIRVTMLGFFGVVLSYFALGWLGCCFDNHFVKRVFTVFHLPAAGNFFFSTFHLF